MLKALKQARSAVGMLNPDEVGRRARQPVRIGLVAFDGAGYAAMEEFLGPALDHVYRAGDPGVPDKVTWSCTNRGSLARRTLTFSDSTTLRPPSRRFCATMRIWSWRWRASLRHSGSRWWRASSTQCRGERGVRGGHGAAQLVPSLGELPWAFGEFASDTAFLTANQVRMAFLIAAACGKEVGYSQRAAEILSIAAGAFGWRALARELAGKIPFGAGIIPKGAIAYAGTFVVGKGWSITTTPARHTRARNVKKCTRRLSSAGRRLGSGPRQVVNVFALSRVVQLGRVMRLIHLPSR